MIYIYGLHGGDGEIRYVGKSVRPQRRLKEHIRDAETGVRTYKCAWIRKIIASGGVVRYVGLASAESCEEANRLEREEISARLGGDARLVNETLGGDGGYGAKPSAETLAKRSAALRGLVRTAETRARMSIAAKRRMLDAGRVDCSSDKE